VAVWVLRVTLLAIVLATKGLVVDDGCRLRAAFMEERIPPIGSGIKGSNEIFFAVLSISITLAAVFPLFFLEGFVGRLFEIWSRHQCGAYVLC
jgi:HAE1 family hydrophobic/amphiphilic exporter-1/multidrug efflux pump